MVNIVTSDNNCGKQLSQLLPQQEIGEQTVAFLNKFSGKKIADLAQQYPNLIICTPQNFRGFYARQQENSEKTNQHIWDYAAGTLKTNNIAGFIGDGQTAVAIHSRFDSAEEQHFLHYMLAKVFDPTILQSEFAYNPSPALDLLHYMLAPMYRRAYQKYGLYREYRTRQYNDDRPQGRLDIARHIRENTPFRGTICYSKRLHSYDNRITRLLAHTFLYVKQVKHYDAQNKQAHGRDVELQAAMRALKLELPPAQLKNTPLILQQTGQPIRSPYAGDYETLRKLCRAILQWQKLQQQGKAGQVHGILFDIAWLWEEYLGILLQEGEFTKTYARQTNGVPIYPNSTDSSQSRIYPDFYSKKSGIVLDAKYKRLDSKDLGKNAESHGDRDQLIRYLYLLSATRGILLYPTSNADGGQNFNGKLNGYGGTLETYGFCIPQKETDFVDFKREMEKTEREFLDYIDKLTDKAA